MFENNAISLHDIAGIVVTMASRYLTLDLGAQHILDRLFEEIEYFVLAYLHRIHWMYPFRTRYPRDVLNGNLALLWQLHLRSFSTAKPTREREDVFGLVAGRHSSRDLGIEECHRSLALLLSIVSKQETKQLDDAYIIMRLADDPRDYRTEAPEMRLCKPGTGIAMFQRAVWMEINMWNEDWRKALDQIDDELAFKVCNSRSRSPFTI